MLKIKRRFVLKKPSRLVLISLTLVSLFVLIPALVSMNNQNHPDFSALESYLTAEMKRSLVPGLSLAVFNEREIIYSRGFGVKDTRTGTQITQTTVFQAASLSETITAYAALILVERGLLALDTPLNQYLKQPYLSNRKAAGRITLRMVLNHTSGLSNDSDGKDRKIYFTPGSLFSYSGGGFRYLQQVMETVTNLPLAEFIDLEIIKPLNMESSSFSSKEELVPFLANGHEAGRAFPISKMPVNAAYSLLTTPEDMARFNMEICHPKLLKPETVALMLTPGVKWQKNIYWGLGVGLLKTPGEEFVWHWGNNYYYCSLMITGKDSKSGVVIMTNGNTGMRLAGRLAIKIINEYFLGPGQSLDPNTFDLIR